MSTERYVVLGLSRARSEPFRMLAQWAHASSVPVELVKCVSAEELRARLASGQRYSAALLDAGLTTVERDLIDVAARRRCPVVVVQDDRRRRDWTALGAAAVLPVAFDRDMLVEALRANSHPVPTGGDLPHALESPPTQEQSGILVAVCGPGGTGTSTCSIALAQSFASLDDPGFRGVLPPRPGARDTLGNDNRQRDPKDGRARSGPVLLADLARRSEQAMLHDAGDVVPGIRELVEAHRSGQPSAHEVVALTFLVLERGYHLLLGLHRPEAWSSLRPRTFEATLETLLQVFPVVVCDTDSDVEGEREGGSLDVEERNVMARSAIGRADVIFAIGRAGMKGVYSLSALVGSLLRFGVPPASVVPVLTHAPRAARARSELHSAMRALAGSALPEADPTFIPERRVDDWVREGCRLPPVITAPLHRACLATLARRPPVQGREPQPVAPGSLGGEGLADRVGLRHGETVVG